MLHTEPAPLPTTTPERKIPVEPIRQPRPTETPDPSTTPSTPEVIPGICPINDRLQSIIFSGLQLPPIA